MQDSGCDIFLRLEIFWGREVRSGGVVLVGRVGLFGGFFCFAWYSSGGRFVLSVRHFCWAGGGGGSK